jgi:hypothetical protein
MINMKSIIKKKKTGRWGIILIALLCFPSCEDFLTKTPIHQVSDAGYWKDEKEVKTWMSGIYNGVNTALQDKIVWWGENRSDSRWPVANGGLAYSLNDIEPRDGYANWNSLYTVIMRCNIAIQQIPNVPLSETTRNTYMGQCYGVRALMYFWLIRVWGDVPLILEAWNGNPETKYNSRTPVDQILPVIENDINEAIRMAGNTGVWYFSTGAALAMYAYFLEWCKLFAEIPDVFRQLNNLNLYSLAPAVRDWNKNFSDPETSSESIFSLYYSITQSDNVRSPYATTIGWASVNHTFCSSKKIYELMIRDTLDIRFWGVMRRSDFTEQLTPANTPNFAWMTTAGGLNWRGNICKYAPLGADNGTFNISTTEWPYKPPVYRYADVVLLYAEALNRIGDKEGAFTVLDQLRYSRGAKISDPYDYPDPFGNTEGSVEKLIYDERQLEFYGEGKRWFDLMRVDWGMEVVNEHVRYIQERSGVEITGFNNRNRLYWPVHQNVLNANPNIVQSEAYQ